MSNNKKNVFVHDNYRSSHTPNPPRGGGSSANRKMVRMYQRDGWGYSYNIMSNNIMNNVFGLTLFVIYVERVRVIK